MRKPWGKRSALTGLAAVCYCLGVPGNEAAQKTEVPP